jgi:hypothetical protein
MLLRVAPKVAVAVVEVLVDEFRVTLQVAVLEVQAPE